MRMLPWTVMPIFVAPIAGLLSDRIGVAPADGDRARAPGDRDGLAGRGLDARPSPTPRSLGPFILAGAGMALVFAPAANAVLGAVRPEEAGQASGATNAIRELGGVLGVAVLASVFARTAATPRRRPSWTA